MSKLQGPRKLISKPSRQLNAPPAAAKVIEEQLKKISTLDPASPDYNTTRSPFPNPLNTDELMSHERGHPFGCIEPKIARCPKSIYPKPVLARSWPVPIRSLQTPHPPPLIPITYSLETCAALPLTQPNALYAMHLTQHTLHHTPNPTHCTPYTQPNALRIIRYHSPNPTHFTPYTLHHKC